MTNTHCRGASHDELEVLCLHPPRLHPMAVLNNRASEPSHRSTDQIRSRGHKTFSTVSAHHSRGQDQSSSISPSDLLVFPSELPGAFPGDGPHCRVDTGPLFLAQDPLPCDGQQAEAGLSAKQLAEEPPTRLTCGLSHFLL